MNTLDRLALRGMLCAAAVLAACGTGGDDGSVAADEDGAETGASSETEGETEGETEDTPGETGETGGEDVDPLAECRMLAGADTWLSGAQPEATASSTPERIAAAGEQTWAVALDMLRVIDHETHPSIAHSPASMYASLGLAYGRHSMECAARIHEVMHFTEVDDDMHHTIGASLVELKSRAQEATDEADPVVVSFDQSTWDLRGGTTMPAPSELHAIYGATPHVFGGEQAEANDVMNCVVEAQSQGLLTNFLPEGQPAADTEAYDLSVSFLQAPWATALSERTVEFHRADGTTESVDGFGADAADAVVFDGEGFLSVSLPLRSDAMSVMIVVPDPSVHESLAAFEAAIDIDTLATARAEGISYLVDLAVPKVDIEPATIDYGTDETLAFACPIFELRAVWHSATVQLDAKGIRAAAATAAEDWGSGGEESDEREIVVDRPFLFFVYDHQTEYVLYSGRYSPGA